MRILIMKSIFCPNEKYLNISIKSFYKINIFMGLVKDIDFDILMIGWAHIYGNHIMAASTGIGARVIYELFTINYGKYKMLNHMIHVMHTHQEYDAVVFLDHDIYFDVRDIDRFRKLVRLVAHPHMLMDGANIGLIAFNHKNDIRHQPTIYDNQDASTGLVFVYPNIGERDGAIANGAFMLSRQAAIALDYFELKTVYGFDDTLLCRQLENKGMRNVVARDIYVVHPFDNNVKYTEWKKNNIINTANGTIKNYYRNIEESMNVFQ